MRPEFSGEAGLGPALQEFEPTGVARHGHYLAYLEAARRGQRLRVRKRGQAP